MLNKRETEVMSAVYSLCAEEGRCLVSPAELLRLLPSRKMGEDGLESVLKQLELDGYFELLLSDRKGEKMYVITLQKNGLSFKRETALFRRDALLKIGWAILSAVLAFVIGALLKRIF